VWLRRLRLEVPTWWYEAGLMAARATYIAGRAVLLKRWRPRVLRLFLNSRLAADSLGLGKKVTSWAIVQKLCKFHPEYEGGLAKKLHNENGQHRRIREL
jgi:hypothetical protein